MIVAGGLMRAGAAAQSPTVTLTLTPDRLAEDARGTDITVTAALSATRTTPTAIPLSLAGTANRGANYLASEILPSTTMPADALQSPATLVISPVSDTIREGDDTIAVNGSASGLTVNGTVLTLEDDEERPELVLSPNVFRRFRFVPRHLRFATAADRPRRSRTPRSGAGCSDRGPPSGDRRPGRCS